MEKINDKYYLDSDKYNLILIEKKIGKKGKSAGKECFVNVGYFTSIEQLYKSIIEQNIKDDLGLINNIQKIADMINELKDFNKGKEK